MCCFSFTLLYRAQSRHHRCHPRTPSSGHCWIANRICCCSADFSWRLAPRRQPEFPRFSILERDDRRHLQKHSMKYMNIQPKTDAWRGKIQLLLVHTQSKEKLYTCANTQIIFFSSFSCDTFLILYLNRTKLIVIVCMNSAQRSFAPSARVFAYANMNVDESVNKTNPTQEDCHHGKIQWHSHTHNVTAGRVWTNFWHISIARDTNSVGNSQYYRRFVDDGCAIMDSHL